MPILTGIFLRVHLVSAFGLAVVLATLAALAALASLASLAALATAAPAAAARSPYPYVGRGDCGRQVSRLG